MMLGPKAQALSHLVPTKYLFLPYSQTQSSEIPFFFFLQKAKGSVGSAGYGGSAVC